MMIGHWVRKALGTVTKNSHILTLRFYIATFAYGHYNHAHLADEETKVN